LWRIPGIAKSNIIPVQLAFHFPPTGYFFVRIVYSEIQKSRKHEKQRWYCAALSRRQLSCFLCKFALWKDDKNVIAVYTFIMEQSLLLYCIDKKTQV
jgi:hypothetical protein